MVRVTGGSWIVPRDSAPSPLSCLVMLVHGALLANTHANFGVHEIEAGSHTTIGTLVQSNTNGLAKCWGK